jgi:hypothetical protein
MKLILTLIALAGISLAHNLTDEFYPSTLVDGSYQLVGSHNWAFSNLAGSGSGSPVPSEAGHDGLYRITSGATSGNGVQLSLNNNTVYPFAGLGVCPRNSSPSFFLWLLKQKQPIMFHGQELPSVLPG